MADAWRRSGQEGVLRVVRKVNQGQEHELRVRWVWFDARPGDPFFPSVSAERLTTVTIQQHLAVEALDPDGGPQLDIYWPVALGARRRGGLEFAHAMTELQDNQREIVRRSALLIGGMALLSGLLAAALGIRLVGRPLRALMEKTRLISAGNLQGPIHLGTHDELADLGESLNLMCQQLAQSQGKIREETATRIAAMEQLRHADRLKTVGRMASGIAHELGTPLSVVAGRAGLIGSGKLSADEVGQSAAAIKAEADKMTKIIRQLLDFARANTPRKAAVDLRQVARQTVDLLRPLAEKRNVELRLAAGDPAVAEIDAGQIQQVLTNLLVNAVEAMPGGGKADITIRSQAACPPEGGDARPSHYYAVEVRDEGVGIAEQHLWRLFEPFFTTKEVGEGTGLGLSIAYGIVQEHGGWIERQQPAGSGELVCRFFARGSQAVKPRILIVDDERSMCDLLETDLRLRDYAPCCFTAAEEALEAFCREDFAVVLTDLMMPGMDGIEFCRRLAANRPDVPVIVMTAFGSLETAIAAIRAGAYDFVTKPIELELLAVILRRAIERRQLQEQIRSLRGGRAVGAVRRIARRKPPHAEALRPVGADRRLRRFGADRRGKRDGEGTGGPRLHQRSLRRDRPFVAVNCAALPETLLESELFGHVKGAFTDARSDRKGLFLQAEGGTLLLDEIGEMPLAMQPKLLRALEENKLRPVGSEREVVFDARILATTNRDLETAVEERRFRQDLFFRINVIQVELPPLAPRRRRPAVGPALCCPVRRAGRETSAGHGPAGGRKTPGVLLARQRPRAAQRDRAGRGSDALRPDHPGRLAGETARLSRSTGDPRQRRSGGVGAAGGGGAPLHPARPGRRRRKSHVGRPDPGARPENALSKAAAVWCVGRGGGVGGKVTLRPRTAPSPACRSTAAPNRGRCGDRRSRRAASP